MAITTGELVRSVAIMNDVNGSQIENVYHHQYTGTPDVTESAYLTGIEAELSAMYATVEGQIPNTLTPVEIVCDVVVFSSGKVITVRAVGTIAWTTWAGGTGSGEGLPQGVAAVVNFPTSSVGVVGRKYLGPFGEGAQSGGVLTSAAQTALASFAAAFLDGFTLSASTLFPILMSTKFAAPVGGLTSVVKAVMGYQRRRKAGRGS